jgi:hypothetical protein
MPVADSRYPLAAGQRLLECFAPKVPKNIHQRQKRRLAMGNRDRQKREQKKPKQPKKPAPPIRAGNV